MGSKKTIAGRTIAERMIGKRTIGKRTSSRKTASQHSASKLVTNTALPPRRRCIIIKDPKHRGEWTELVFMSRVAERGFNVSKPWGDSSRYDVAVERRGHFLRVQVKSTTARQCGGYVVTIKGRCQHYTRHQVDLFAIYVIPDDVWYILPAEIIIPIRSNFLLAPRRPRQKYEAYKEAWHLLNAGRREPHRESD